MFALADKCHGWQRKGGPVMTRNTCPLSFRKSTVVASIRVRGGQSFLRGFYGNPTLRAMHSIHKCVAKGRSTFISLTAVECVRWTHGIKIERNNLLCEQAPTEVFRSIFAWLVTFNLLVFILILRMEICEGGAVRQLPEHPGVDPNEKRNGYRG